MRGKTEKETLVVSGILETNREAEGRAGSAMKGGERGVTRGGAGSAVKGGERGVTKGGAESVTKGGAEGVTKGGAEGVTKGGAEGVAKGGAEGVTKGGAESVIKGGQEGVTNSAIREVVAPVPSFAAGTEAAASFLPVESFRRTEARAGRQRVAAYIRVSTDHDDQENSYQIQEGYFNRLLAGNPEWESAGIYSDYGLSGTSGEKRAGFRRILRHCREGRLDRIVCKSISRFARNTSDFITSLQVLHDCNVTIMFEKEALDTADPTSDFILTTLGAIAQEESRSISDNINWGNKKRFPRGEVRNQELYGYRYSGEIFATESGYRYRAVEIVDEEAVVVRQVFQEAAKGSSYTVIARKLNRDGARPPESHYTRRRKVRPAKGQLKKHIDAGWTAENILQMLRLERYAGDVLIQKTYTADYLTHKIRKNKGEVVQYLVRDHHPAIISRELYEEVQAVIDSKSRRLGEWEEGELEGGEGKGESRGEGKRERKGEGRGEGKRERKGEGRVEDKIEGKGEGGGEDEEGKEQGREPGRKRKLHAFSGRLLCAECGRYYHVRNGKKAHPAWACPSISRRNGRTLCHSERVYEEQIVRMFRKAVTERFQLTVLPVMDHMAADIMNGHFEMDEVQLHSFSQKTYGFVAQMQARLENTQRLDNTERDRAFHQRRISAVRLRIKNTHERIRLLQIGKEPMEPVSYGAGKEGCAGSFGGMTRERLVQLEAEEKHLVESEAEEAKLIGRLEYLENYWAELEADFDRREAAIEWMKALPAGMEGMVKFLNGMADEYVGAFALSITIRDPLHYTVHWFDDTRTDVEMYSNIEDHRFTAAYLKKQGMKEKSFPGKRG